MHTAQIAGVEMMPFTAPVFGEEAFNCPLCGAYAKQTWYEGHGNVGSIYRNFDAVKFSLCEHCDKYVIWLEGRMIFPTSGTAPLPNPDLPPDVSEDYEEARSMASLSPRGASALLRLAIQKLCIGLGGKGENLNQDIAELVRRGLPARLQKAFDIVRVIGNNAVHPGQIDLSDNIGTTQQLFSLVNLVADSMMSQPKRIDALYSRLPEPQKEAIAKRDSP